MDKQQKIQELSQDLLASCEACGQSRTDSEVRKSEAFTAELLQDERRFKTLTNLSPAGIFRTDPDGTCTYVNPAWERMSGLSAEQAEGFGWSDAIAREDKEWVQEKWGAAVKARIEFRSEFRFQRPDGHISWMDVIAAPELAPDGTLLGFIGVNIDISESKALEESLIAARRRAEAAADAKSRFLANMSHEIRTPMNGVIGFTQLLLDSDLHDEQRKQLEMVLDSGNAMMRLLNDILDISKVEAGQTISNLKPLDIRHILKSCVTLMAPSADQKGLAITLNIAPEIPVHIIGDNHHLRQIILNLIGNAVKFTHNGQINISATMLVNENPEQIPLIKLSVEDTGIGISGSRQEAIFDPFEQADSTTAQEYGGSGLGLTISKQLAQMMNGEISLESKVGQGTTFHFQFPAQAIEKVNKETKKVEIELLTKPVIDCKSGTDSDAQNIQSNGYILLAEDHDVNQVLIKAMTERLGYETELAVDGADAVSKIDQASENGRLYDLILMDLQMPVMGGYEATRMIRSSGIDPQTLPIIAITANAFSDDIEACMAAGMQAHVAKPVMIENLRNTLEEWTQHSNFCRQETMPIEIKSLLDGELGERYLLRKKQAMHCLTSLVRSGTYTEMELHEVADHLHKLAGTAAMFGDGDLGIQAKLIENGLTQWKIDDRPKNIKHAVNEFLKAA